MFARSAATYFGQHFVHRRLGRTKWGFEHGWRTDRKNLGFPHGSTAKYIHTIRMWSVFAARITLSRPSQSHACFVASTGRRIRFQSRQILNHLHETTWKNYSFLFSSNGYLEEKEVKVLFWQLANAVKFMQTQRVVHRDLKESLQVFVWFCIRSVWAVCQAIFDICIHLLLRTTLNNKPY